MENNNSIKEQYEKVSKKVADFQGRDLSSLSPKERKEYKKALNTLRRLLKEPISVKLGNGMNVRTRAQILSGLGALALVGLNACSNPKSPTSEESAEPTQIEMVAENEDVDVSEINATINDVTEFINDSISKGLIYYDLDESDKNIVAKVALDYYLMANQNSLSQKTFNILNQDGELNASYMLGNTFNFETVLQEFVFP